MSDLANNAAALTAGYIRTQTDRGSGAVPRYISAYDKQMVNADAGGFLEKAVGHSQSSQAAADTTALAALNAQRAHRYGPGATNRNKTARGTTLTLDN